MKKGETYTRISQRIMPSHHAFIKKYAKKNKISEGEALRTIISSFMKK